MKNLWVLVREIVSLNKQDKILILCSRNYLKLDIFKCMIMNIDYKKFKKNDFLIIPNFINSENKEFVDLSIQLETEVKKKIF